LDVERRTALRTRLLDINPVYWLVARNDRQRVLLWAFVPAVAFCGILLFLTSRTLGGTTFGLSTVLNLGLALVLKLWVAWQTCATWAEARRNGVTELLLATPLRVSEIIYGHWQALQRLFLVPTVALVILQVLPALEVMLDQGRVASPPFWLPFPTVSTVLGIATLVLDLVALAWVGMWMGLSHPKTVQAFGKTIIYVMLVPMLVFCFPNILFDLFWITWARRKLEVAFRSAAAPEPAPFFPSAGASPASNAEPALPPVIPG
jgi:hypothetical protein